MMSIKKTVLCCMIIINVFFITACSGAQAEEDAVYQESIYAVENNGTAYQCYETEKLKVTYPTTDENAKMAETMIKVMPSVKNINVLFISKQIDERFLFAKIMMLADPYSQDEHVVQAVYELYNCCGRLSKISKAEAKTLKLDNYLAFNTIGQNVFESSAVSFSKGEYDSLLEKEIILPFHIQIIADKAFAECSSEKDTYDYVISELEKAVVKATVTYDDGTVKTVYHKLDYSAVR